MFSVSDASLPDPLAALSDPPAAALAELHDAAERVQTSWEQLTSVSGADTDDDELEQARRYIGALWRVQAAEENYLVLRERLLGA